MTREWLDVPFSEKDRAKACGARWDPAAKRWYAPRPGMPGLERWAARPDLPTLLPGEDRAFGGAVLVVDPVPETCWFKNARSSISERDWERVRRMVTKRAGYRCEICRRPEDRRVAQWLEAHERWSYDLVTRTQRLQRLILLCTACHTVVHFGLAQIQGKDAAAFRHLCEVTGMSESEANRHLESAVALWQRRSEIPWNLDLSILTGAGVEVVRAAPANAPPHDASRARILHEPPPPRPPATTYANRPRDPELGSRWERWLRTGER